MQRTRALLLLFIGINLVILGMSVASIIASLADAPDALDLLMVAARAVSVVCALLIIVQAIALAMAVRRIERASDLDDLEPLVGRIERSSTWLTVFFSLLIWSIIAGTLINALQHLQEGDIPRALVDVVLAGLLVWIDLRDDGPGGRKRSISKLIGEKSRALRDKLVEAQKGMQPSPGFAG